MVTSMLYSFELSFYYTRHLPCDLKLIVWKITGCSSSGFQRDLRSDNLNMYICTLNLKSLSSEEANLWRYTGLLELGLVRSDLENKEYSLKSLKQRGARLSKHPVVLAFQQDLDFGHPFR